MCMYVCVCVRASCAAVECEWHPALVPHGDGLRRGVRVLGRLHRNLALHAQALALTVRPYTSHIHTIVVP